MKNLNVFLSAILVLSSVPSAFSAELINNAAGKQKIGVVTASGELTLDETVAELSKKADQKGASAFKILALSGDNTTYGSAEIYK